MWYSLFLPCTPVLAICKMGSKFVTLAAKLFFWKAQGPAQPEWMDKNIFRMERMDMCDVISAHESHGFYYFSGAFGSNGDEYFWSSYLWNKFVDKFGILIWNLVTFLKFW